MSLNSGCEDKREYELTVVHLTHEGKFIEEASRIFAENDSTAFVAATTSYMLALHAYNRAEKNAKAFLNKPVRFNLINSRRSRVDSLLGEKITNAISENVRRSIN